MVAKKLQLVVCNKKVLEKVVVLLVARKILEKDRKFNILQFIFNIADRLENHQEKFADKMIYLLCNLIERGGLTIEEISYTVKLAEIVTTAECVMTLEEQNHLWKGLVQCVAHLDPSSLADLQQNRHTFQIVLSLKTILGCSMVFTREEEKNEFETEQSFSLRMINSQGFHKGYVHCGLNTRSNTERDYSFATYTTKAIKHLLRFIAQQKHSITGKYKYGFAESVVEFAPKPFNYFGFRGKMTDTHVSSALKQYLLQTWMSKIWFMNSVIADRLINMKIENEAERIDMSWKHVDIMMYCDDLNSFISQHERMIPKEQALLLQRLTQEMRIAFQHFVSNFNDNHIDDCLGTYIEMKLQDTSGPVSMKTNGELRKEEYNLLTNSTKCQLCVDRNKAVNWCNTCGKNICDFCKVFHQKVWDVMDHDILPLRIAY